MKPYTDVLINSVEGGSKWYKKDPDMLQVQYEAHHRDQDIYILWMEACLLGRRRCLPCALVEDGDAILFKSSAKFASSTENSGLIKRWSLLITPEVVRQDFVVTQLSESDFRLRFKELRDSISSKDEATDDTTLEGEEPLEPEPLPDDPIEIDNTGE